MRLPDQDNFRLPLGKLSQFAAPWVLVVCQRPMRDSTQSARQGGVRLRRIRWHDLLRGQDTSGVVAVQAKT